VNNGILSICWLELSTVVWTIPFGKDVAIPEALFRTFGINVVHSFKLQNTKECAHSNN